MSLDIYKLKIAFPKTKEEKDNLYDFPLDEIVMEMAFENTKELFNKFKSYVIQENVECIDWEKTYKKHNVIYEKDDIAYQFCELSDNESDYILLDYDGKEIKLYKRDLVTFYKKVPYLYFKKTDEDFGSLNSKFYKKFSKSKVKKGEYVIFAYNQKMLDEAKKYAFKYSEMKDWILDDDEIVWFSW